MDDNQILLDSLYRQITVSEILEKISNCGMIWDKISMSQYQAILLLGNDVWETNLSRMGNGSVILDVKKNGTYAFSVNSFEYSEVVDIFSELDEGDDAQRDIDILQNVAINGVGCWGAVGTRYDESMLGGSKTGGSAKLGTTGYAMSGGVKFGGTIVLLMGNSIRGSGGAKMGGLATVRKGTDPVLLYEGIGTEITGMAVHSSMDRVYVVSIPSAGTSTLTTLTKSGGLVSSSTYAFPLSNTVQDVQVDVAASKLFLGLNGIVASLSIDGSGNPSALNTSFTVVTGIATSIALDGTRVYYHNSGDNSLKSVLYNGTIPQTHASATYGYKLFERTGPQVWGTGDALGLTFTDFSSVSSLSLSSGPPNYQPSAGVAFNTASDLIYFVRETGPDRYIYNILASGGVETLSSGPFAQAVAASAYDPVNNRIYFCDSSLFYAIYL